jgi:predicted phage-related endonuclease
MENKKRYIGASIAAAAVGMHRTHTPSYAYARAMGLMPDMEYNVACEIGKHCEPFMASWYEREFSVKLDTSRSDYKSEPFKKAEYPWMIGHPDALIAEQRKGVEFKVAGLHSARDWGDPSACQVPQEYYIQCLCYMILTGYKEWDLVVMLGTEIKVYPLEYDQETAEGLLARMEKFWKEHLCTGIPPSPDASEDCKNLMGWMYNKNNGKIDFATTDELQALRLLADVKRNLVAEEGNFLQASNAVKALIKDRDGLKWDGHDVTWKARKDGVRVFKINLRGDE